MRDEDDNVFVYGRMSDSEDPKDYSDILPDLGVASLLEGFNDAVTKFICKCQKNRVKKRGGLPSPL